MIQNGALLLTGVLECLQVYHKAGYPGFVARLQERGPEYVNAVNWMSYQMAPRAQIFRRDSSNITDFDSLKSVMRYNRYKDDPVSPVHTWTPGTSAIALAFPGLTLICFLYQWWMFHHAEKSIKSI